MQRLTWHFPGRGQRESPAYYLSEAFDLEGVRIYAGQAPTASLKVDILEDGVSIFADTASQVPPASIPITRQATSTWVCLEGGETYDLDAEDFRKNEIGPGWITCVIGSDGGASNITVQLDIDIEDDEVSE